MKTLYLAALLFVPFAHAEAQIVDTWKYTTRKPAEGWQREGFEDGAWKRGSGGFGTRGTPGARMGTSWRTNDIWLRKTVALTRALSQPALLIHHDEDAEVHINGRLVATFTGYATEYEVVPLGAEEARVLRVGKNLLAVHCRQTGGGQFIDVHVVDAGDVPKLPVPEQSRKPYQSELITTWGSAVSAENAWTEYPRPQLVRDAWRNLNGHWEYAITPAEQTEVPSTWAGKILVPFCLESRLSGVQRRLDASEALWYRRVVRGARRDARRTLLNFEAVDYSCEVFVNRRSVGTHRGGNTPFAFEITDAWRDGDNEIIVRVEDDTEAWQLRGKQVLDPRGIWYTQVSGIWQTVWLEHVGASYIRDLKITTQAETGTLSVRPRIEGDATVVDVLVKDGAQTFLQRFDGSQGTSISIENAKLWSPTSPHLYDLQVTLYDASNEVLDRVRSYAGIRTVSRVRDAQGHLRFALNGKPIFHHGPLDQGWWPDGLLTPPSDEAMAYDVEFLKRAGFNMIRKHIKVESRRYYHHCDRLGMLVWQDQVSGGKGARWTRLGGEPRDSDWPEEHHRQFMLEFERMIDTLENHPSIVVWVPFNEAWGQHRTMEVGAWVARRDPTRLINIASGGNFWPVGDIIDHHRYPEPGFPFEPQRDRDFIKVIGEFGGHGYPVAGHLWDAKRRNWGYGGLPKTRQEYRERYVKTLTMLAEFRRRGIAAGVYTQTTDVEGEVNGLMTYDRKVAKIDVEELAALHARALGAGHGK